MSKVKIQGNASGTGVVTLTAPNTNTDRTITLPDSTGTLVDNTTAVEKDSNGNVGIGVVPESHYTGYVTLDIGNSGGLYSNNTGTNATLLTDNSYLNSGATNWLYKNTDEASQYNQSSGKHIFKVAPSGTADTAISWTTALEITNDGRGLSQFTAKAWVNFNGAGTVAIRDSHNVSSITDSGTGNYKVNFTNAMGNTNYSYSAGGWSDRIIGQWAGQTVTTTQFPVSSYNSSTSYEDCDYAGVQVFGD